jgi:hypothetical protein
MTTQRTITLTADQWDVILDAVECHCDEGPPGEGWKSSKLSAASAALSSALEQPKLEELSHETAARNAVESCLAQREEVLEAFIAKHGFCPDEAIQVEQRLEDGSTTWRIERRAALTQPKPQAPTDVELQELLYYEFTTSTGHGERSDPIGFAQAVLTRWGRPSIEPVPVSERPWEREGWCDGDGWCWWFDADGSDPCWVFDQPQFVIWTHCLPAHALPLPVPTQHS